MDASLVSAISDVVMVILTVGVLCVAYRGLRSWKEQKIFERDLNACRRLEDSVRVMRCHIHMLITAVERSKPTLDQIRAGVQIEPAEAHFLKDEIARLVNNVEFAVFDFRSVVGEAHAIGSERLFEPWVDIAHTAINLALALREVGLLAILASESTREDHWETIKARADQYATKFSKENPESEDGDLSRLNEIIRNLEATTHNRLKLIYASHSK